MPTEGYKGTQDYLSFGMSYSSLLFSWNLWAIIERK